VVLVAAVRTCAAQSHMTSHPHILPPSPPGRTAAPDSWLQRPRSDGEPGTCFLAVVLSVVPAWLSVVEFESVRRHYHAS
jgi:hypothetical protein